MVEEEGDECLTLQLAGMFLAGVVPSQGQALLNAPSIETLRPECLPQGQT